MPEAAILIAIVFFCTYFIESVFWFGGLVLGFAILWLFLDIESFVYLSLYVPVLASIFVICTDYRSVSWVLFRKMLPIVLVWVIAWVFLFTRLSGEHLLKVFAVFLLVLSLQGLLAPKIKLQGMFSKAALLVSWGVQGMFGTGWPFAVAALRDRSADKSELRATMAIFFVFFNLVRAVQLYIQDELYLDRIIPYWWLIIVLLVAIFGWYQVHIRFSDRWFRVGIHILLLIAGLILLIR